MKQLVILSGKGGTGKTSLAAAFAHLAATSVIPLSAVLVDADVDAANLELVLSPRVIDRHEFLGGQTAVINPDLCGGCGTCKSVCRFNAVIHDDDNYKVDRIACDGCAACVYQCPQDAIEMQINTAGEWSFSQSRYGPLFHAALRPSQENSGKLVTLVKQHARLYGGDNSCDLVLVDGPPGTGCPAISAISGADLALVVVEPTAAGESDMRRILQTTEHFRVPTLVCINKADQYLDGKRKIEEYCQETNTRVVGTVPYDPAVTEAMVNGEPLTNYRPDSPASIALQDIWEAIVYELEAVLV